MHILVTGASGWVGSVVVQELLTHGHQVTGVLRSEAGEAALTAAGATVVRGSLEDPDSLAAAAAKVDGVIHTAFNHDFSKFAHNAQMDRRAIAALGHALKGSKRPLIVTSGVAHLAAGRLATEQDCAPPVSERFPRASEAAAAALVADGIDACVVRLPPSVHGAGDHGFVPLLIQIARQKGVSAYIEDGQNRWPAVHRLDAARVFRLAIEGGAKGGPFHAIAEEGVYFKEIAKVIARRLNVALTPIPAAQASEHFGWFAGFAALDCPATAKLTCAQLAWKPKHPTLLADLDDPSYFGG